MSFFDNLRAAFRANLAVPQTRTQGLPTSTNGASSMHLNWQGLPRACLAVEVDLEVRGQPSTSHLRFWALQASFVDGATTHGAGHLGLQWIDGYPGRTAVNWGGYRNGGGELTGTTSALPSARGNVNTRNFEWTPGEVYGLRIEKTEQSTVRPGESRWLGSVTARSTGVVTVIRELECPGTHLLHVVMWSELFAPCDAAPHSIAWSNARAFTSVEAHPVTRFSVSYQSVADGGCSNTTVSVEPAGFVSQTSSVERTIAAGSTIE